MGLSLSKGLSNNIIIPVIKDAIESGIINQEDVNESVKKNNIKI